MPARSGATAHAPGSATRGRGPASSRSADVPQQFVLLQPLSGPGQRLEGHARPPCDVEQPPRSIRLVENPQHRHPLAALAGTPADGPVEPPPSKLRLALGTQVE